MRRAVPLSAAALVVLLAAAAVLPSMVIGFDENRMQLRATDSRNGYETVMEHWGVNEAVPEFLLIRADHDMRNTHDLAALESIAIGVSNLPQVAYVRSITRPDGKPIPESAVGYQTQQVANGLGDANRQLKDASPQLKALASGVDQLNTGAGEASRRVPELVAGTQRVTGLASGVLDALTSAQQALATASGGTVDVNAATALLRSAVATLTTAADAVRTAQRQNAGIGEVFGPLVGAASPACAADANCTAARRAFAELDRATSGRASTAVRAATVVLPAGTTDRAATALSQADDALARLQGLLKGLGGLSPEQVKAQLAELNAGVSQLSTGLSQLSAGLGQVKTGTDQVVEMTGRLQEGLGTATDYLTGLSAGTTAARAAASTCPPRDCSRIASSTARACSCRPTAGPPACSWCGASTRTRTRRSTRPRRSPTPRGRRRTAPCSSPRRWTASAWPRSRRRCASRCCGTSCCCSGWSR